MKPSIETIDFHGLEALRLTAPRGASAVVGKLGGQVLSWTTRDGRERLFLSERARFDGSVPIRGGIPVCFPQFSSLGSLPKHGFLRTRQWQVSGQSSDDGYTLLSLETTDDESTRALWPHAFRAEVTVVLEEDRLDVELSIDNLGPEPFSFTGALHTYLRVVEVEDIALAGLYGFAYRDAADGDRIRKENSPELIVEGEIDRGYHNANRPLLLQAGNLSLGIHQEGFPDVVLWNPWVDLCARLPDMAPTGFRHMLCVEAAAARQPVTLAAGENWSGRQSLVAL
ncbi:MAG: Aldose 1-epimerase [Rhodocyclaceae bacterium]|nr:Aldose 1-epimerase [Rhodocyclaceae bacterium]